MSYRFAKERPDYSDFASGRVFYSLPGHPAFPVRLAVEIFQRCLAIREASHMTDPCVLYDPCCGAAYHLSVLGYLHGSAIRKIIGSDIDPEAVSIARKNLELLRLDGLDKRIDEISELLKLYGKESHKAALESSHRLRNRRSASFEGSRLETRVFQANALDGEALRKDLKGVPVDIVLVDVPYDLHSQWQNSDSQSGNPLWQLLDALLSTLIPASVVAVVSDKRQKASHEDYQRIEHFQLGKRRIVLLKPVL